MPKITTNELAPNSTFLIRGKVSFSRITRFMTKAEFDAENQRRTQSGRPTDNKPYAHVSMVNCMVLCTDPNNKTINEQFAEQKLFTSTKAPETGWNYTAKQTGMFETLPDGRVVTTGYLPTVWTQDSNGHFVQIQPQGELANGLDIIAVMRVYKATPNNGVALDRILCMEPIRYYAGNPNLATDLAKYGLTFSPDASINTHVTADTYGAAEPTGQATAPAPTAPVYAPQTPAAPAAPAYTPAAPSYAPQTPAAPTAPAYPPNGQPAGMFSTQPAPAPAPAAPTAPAYVPPTPTAPDASAAQPFGVPPTTFPNSAAAPAPAAPAPGGVATQYNPNTDPQRQY